MNGIFPKEVCDDYYNILGITSDSQDDKDKLMEEIRGEDSIKYDPNYVSYTHSNWDEKRLFQQFIDFNKIIPVSKGTKDCSLRKLDEFGESNFNLWGDLTSFYWGTPINAYDQHCSPGIVKFHTLLRPAPKVVLRLSEMFPAIQQFPVWGRITC